MKKFISTCSITEDQFYGIEKIIGSLYLGRLTSIPEGFNPTVGGDLDLGRLTSIPEGFNPTVGGDLDLGRLTSIPEGFNPTVGGSLYLRSGSKYIGSEINIEAPNKNFIWEKYGKKFALIDGIFCLILNQKTDLIKGKDLNIYSASGIGKESVFFIANIGKFYAHGPDLRKAVEDLEFKIASEKLKKQPIYKDTIIDINHYRIITGACEMGVSQWMIQNGLTQNQYTAGEILPILKKTNAYGLDRFMKLIKF